MREGKNSGSGKILGILAVGILFAAWFPKSVHAQVLKLQMKDPQATTCVGDSFQIDLMINTSGVDTINADALINFNPTNVSIDAATTGNFFTYFSATALSGSTNQYLVSSWEESIAHAKSATADTLLATMTVTGKQTGTTNLALACQAQSEADSNINRASDSEDIIDCSSLVPLSFTVCAAGSGGATPSPTPLGGGGGAISSPTPSGNQNGGVPTRTPTPQYASPTPIPPTPTRIPTYTPIPTVPPPPPITQLPRAGSVTATVAAIGISILFLVIGMASVFI